MTHAGVSLLAIAVCLVRIHRLKKPHREQAHSYRGAAFQMWERACSRRRQCSQRNALLKLWRLKDTSRHAFEATNPCAFAYSQARIRRLVRFGVGFYCGSVADESAIGFSDSNSSQRCIGVPGFVADLYFRDFVMVAVCGRPSGLPGAFDRFANLRTAATPPV